MADLLAAALRALERAGAEFGDVRMENRNAFVARVANEQLQAANHVHRQGWGARAFVRGAWGYVSGTNATTAAVAEGARRAVAIARAGGAAGVPASRLRRLPSAAKTVRPRVKVEPRDVTPEEKIEAAVEVCRAQKIDRVPSRSSVYVDSDNTFEVTNSWGARIRWREVRTRIGGQAVASEGDRREAAYDFRDGTVGWEIVRNLDLASFGRTIGEEAVANLAAQKPPGGLTTVIADPGVAGLLAHEVIGHASEGDEIVKRRSFLTTQVGKRVGSDLVTMFDDGTYPGGHGTIPFDAEGTAARRTKVIERGVYRRFLQSLETSSALRAPPTGNGRAQDFGRRVWVRMTNTYFAPGRDRKDDIIAETKRGVLTHKWISGMEDPVGGGFQAVTQSGFLIDRGEVGSRLRGMTLTGSALSILKSVDRVSREFALDGGSCGKGEEDYVPVAAGGPFMRCKIVVGGG